jgi:hypothetical protein
MRLVRLGRVAVPLNDRQVAQLGASIDEYRFPPVYFDFVAEEEVLGSNMGTVEAAIHAMLASPSTEDVRYGLANVIYWAMPRSRIDLSGCGVSWSA